jgi:enolase
MNPINQKEIDEKMKELDGTDNKGKLGANAILAVSMAVCKVGGPTRQLRIARILSLSLTHTHTHTHTHTRALSLFLTPRPPTSGRSC